MFILGLLSLAQVLLLPGLVILSLLQINLSVLKRLLLSFGLSLFSNYCFVIFLHFVGFYNRTSLLIILFLEVSILVFLHTKKLLILGKMSPSEIATGIFSFAISIANLIKNRSENITGQIRQNERTGNNKYLAEGIVYFLAVVTIIVCFAGCFISCGDVFKGYDAINDWNHWAMSWSEDTIPVNTHNYPQLIPINWSVCYVMLGQTLEMFPKFVNSLMFPMLMLSIFLWAKDKNSQGMQLGCMVTACSFATAFNEFLYDGYVDIAVACMIIMSLYCLFLASRQDSALQFGKLLFVGMLIAFASAVTKQAGIILLIVYPAIALGVVKSKKDVKFSILKGTLVYVIFLVLTVLPFYAYQRKEIHDGRAKSEVEYVTNTIHQGRSIPQRLGHAASLYLEKLLKLDLSSNNIKSLFPHSITKYQGPSYYTKSGIYISYTFFIILFVIPVSMYAFASSFFMHDTKLTIYLFLFFWLIWGCFFSYDIRNVSSAIPFWGNAIGFGLWQLLSLRNYSIAGAMMKIRLPIFVLLVVAGLAVANHHFNPEMMKEKNFWKKVETIGNKSINLELIEIGDKLDQNHKLLTTYWQVRAFEEVTMKNVFACTHFANVTFDGLGVFSQYSESDDFKYILVTPRVPEYIKDYVEEKIKSNYYKILKQTPDYALYEKAEEK